MRPERTFAFADYTKENINEAVAVSNETLRLPIPPEMRYSVSKLYTVTPEEDAGRVIPLSRRFNPQNEDIRYSVTATPYGDVAVIDRDEEIAKINLNDPDSVRQYLQGKVGQQLLDNLVIGGEAPTEYVFSKDAKGNNKRVRKAKAKR